MMEEQPNGITGQQWKYYQLGKTAYAEGEPKENAESVFEMKNRCWWLAGWHDSDMINSPNP
jgi:hypothetical protein